MSRIGLDMQLEITFIYLKIKAKLIICCFSITIQVSGICLFIVIVFKDICKALGITNVGVFKV